MVVLEHVSAPENVLVPLIVCGSVSMIMFTVAFAMLGNVKVPPPNVPELNASIQVVPVVIEPRDTASCLVLSLEFTKLTELSIKDLEDRVFVEFHVLLLELNTSTLEFAGAVLAKL